MHSAGWGQVASEFAIPSLGMVPPDQRTEALRGLMKPLLTGPIADIMNNMWPGSFSNSRCQTIGLVSCDKRLCQLCDMFFVFLHVFFFMTYSAIPTYFHIFSPSNFDVFDISTAPCGWGSRWWGWTTRPFPVAQWRPCPRIRPRRQRSQPITSRIGLNDGHVVAGVSNPKTFWMVSKSW